MALSLTPLFSGSSGNAILISSGTSHILVDAGVSGRRIEEALHSVGQDIRGIKGILITHEHSDHIAGAGILSRKHNIPVYATAPTWEACSEKLGSVQSRLTRVIGKTGFILTICSSSLTIFRTTPPTPWDTVSLAARASLPLRRTLDFSPKHSR